MFDITGIAEGSPLGRIVRAANREPLDAVDVDVDRLLAESGALLFRGFEVNDPIWERFTAKHSSLRVSHGAPHRKDIGGDRFLQEADPGMHEIHLHVELGYLPIRPDLLWFRCITPPVERGETTICDGAALFGSLSRDAQEVFRQRKLQYIAMWAPEVWKRYFQILEKDELSRFLEARPEITHSWLGDKLYFEYTVPAAQATRFGGPPSFANSLLHYYFDGLRESVQFDDGSEIPEDLMKGVLDAAATLTLRIRWQEDDVLMIDNTRILHGRLAHNDPNRKLQARMGMRA